MNITQKVLAYQAGYWTYESTIQAIHHYSIQWIVERWKWNEEEAHEFWQYILPQMGKIIGKYTFTGKSFLRYLHKFIHFQVKSYKKQMIRDNMKQHSFNSLMLSTMNNEKTSKSSNYGDLTKSNQYDFENKVDYSIAEGYPAQSMDTNSYEEIFEDINHLSSEHKKLIVSVFQFLDYIDDEILIEISKQTKVSFVQLLAFRQEAYSIVEHRVEYKQEMYNKRNRRFLKSQYERESAEKKEKSMRILKHTLERIKKIKIRPSFEDFAQITGIPRGTIGGYINSQKKNLYNDDTCEQ